VPLVPVKSHKPSEALAVIVNEVVSVNTASEGTSAATV